MKFRRPKGRKALRVYTTGGGRSNNRTDEHLRMLPGDSVVSNGDTYLVTARVVHAYPAWAPTVRTAFYEAIFVDPDCNADMAGAREGADIATRIVAGACTPPHPTSTSSTRTAASRRHPTRR